jgi:hypothetical protein
MRIKEILKENATDVVARFYKEAGEDYERFYNPEDVKYKNKTEQFYKEYFEDWFNKGQVPVFTKPVTKPQPEYTVKPKPGNLQSPGYRGLQYALAKSGLPYDHRVQRPNSGPAAILASQAYDGP